MISLCQLDAAFRKTRHYNPDLDIELLFRDVVDDEEFADVANIKRALVGRVADIGMLFTLPF